MSLKIGNNISSIKINGHYIKEAKLNGYIVYELKSGETTHYTIDETWSYYVNGSVDGTLSTEIPQNLFDLSNYSFPTTKGGLTFNYDNVKKSLIINGTSNDDFGLYIPLSIPSGNYTFSYQQIQAELGFHFSIDNINSTMLTGWGQNNKTFDLTSSSSQLILLFDTGYTYNNLELSFNLVKNHDLPEPV